MGVDGLHRYRKLGALIDTKQEAMDRIHKNGLNNAHHVPGVLGWQQLQHACLHDMHIF